MVTSSPSILGYNPDSIQAKLALLRDLGFDSHDLFSRFPLIVSYNALRIEFLGAVIRRLQDGHGGHLIALLSKAPLLVAAGAIDAGEPTIKSLRAAMRARRDEDNAALLRANSLHPVAEAYFRYRRNY
jgi:hypothetical protein